MNRAGIGVGCRTVPTGSILLEYRIEFFDNVEISYRNFANFLKYRIFDISFVSNAVFPLSLGIPPRVLYADGERKISTYRLWY